MQQGLLHVEARECALNIFLVCLTKSSSLEIIPLPPCKWLRGPMFEGIPKGWLVFSKILQDFRVVFPQEY